LTNESLPDRFGVFKLHTDRRLSWHILGRS
jgi:hypothetical protein